MERVREEAEKEAKELLRSLARICPSLKIHDSEDGGIQEGEGGVVILLSFDNAQELSRHHGRADGDWPWRSYYDILLSSLDCIAKLPIFTLLLSTAVEDPTITFPRTMVTDYGRKKLHVPITDLPLDCHPRFPSNKTSYNLKDINNIDVAAMFSRPLYVHILSCFL